MKKTQKSRSKNRKKGISKSLLIGMFLVILAIALYGVGKYFIPQFHALKRVEQQQDALWLTAFKSLELTVQQKKQIQDSLLKFDNEKRMSQISMVRHQEALRVTIQSNASHKEKLQQANEKMEALFEAMINLKKADFYYLREIYFNILTAKQRAIFLRENPIVLQPKAIIAKKIKAEMPQAFEGMHLSDEQKSQIFNIIDLSALVDIAYQREVTDFQIHTVQFLKEINEAKVDALFAVLLKEYVVAYNLHKAQYEAIYTQVLTEKQRQGLSRPEVKK